MNRPDPPLCPQGLCAQATPALAALAALSVAWGCPGAVQAQERFTIQAYLGTALNAPTPLTLRQDGEADLSFDARYETRALEPPVYWSVLLSVYNERRGFDLQFTHQKLRLTNRPDEVQHFEVTHGFNLVTFAYRWRTLPVDVRLGGGIVLPHPEGTVRERPYDSPKGGFLGREWHAVGPALLAGVGKRWGLWGNLDLATQAEFVGAWATGVPMVEGSVDVSNVALHVRAGLAYTF